MNPAGPEPPLILVRRSGMHKGQQISWNRHDTSQLRMPPVCAVTGEPAGTAIIVCVGDVDLILPVCDRVRSDHLRPFGAARTAWRLRPTVRHGVITLHNAAREFADQLLAINEPGTTYVGGLYPLKPSRSITGPAARIEASAA